MMMKLTAATLQSLIVYSNSQRVRYVNNPSAHLVLDWLWRLDGTRVSGLLVADTHGWLDIGLLDDGVTISYCNHSLKECRSEIVSRQTAAERFWRFAEGANMLPQ